MLLGRKHPQQLLCFVCAGPSLSSGRPLQGGLWPNGERLASSSTRGSCFFLLHFPPRHQVHTSAASMSQPPLLTWLNTIGTVLINLLKVSFRVAEPEWVLPCRVPQNDRARSIPLPDQLPHVCHPHLGYFISFVLFRSFRQVLSGTTRSSVNWASRRKTFATSALPTTTTLAFQSPRTERSSSSSCRHVHTRHTRSHCTTARRTTTQHKQDWDKRGQTGPRSETRSANTCMYSPSPPPDFPRWSSTRSSSSNNSSSKMHKLSNSNNNNN